MLYSLLLLLFALVFVLAQRVEVRIIRNGRIRVELHLPLIAIVFRKKQGDKKQRRRLPPGYVGALIERTRVLLGKCAVTVSRLPVGENGAPAPYFSGFGLSGALLGLIEEGAGSLIIEDEAFTLSPDDGTTLLLSFRVRLIFLAKAIIGAGADLIKLKPRRIG